ncbi:hypothetical protein BS78_05G012500 [Paspalum vaginatum]|nr:hypothetical protein BS78_05G012500 [Paspalum vaginatum]
MVGVFFSVLIVFSVVLLIYILVRDWRQHAVLETAQMASIALAVLDHITYPVQNAAAGGGSAAAAADSGSSASSERCAICRGTFQDGDWCSVMPLCRHKFHRNCIAGVWLRAYDNTCPSCRTQLHWTAQDMV